MRSFLSKALGIVLTVSSLALADQIAVDQFGYLNSNSNSTIIDPSEAQDLLNVEVSASGKSIKKRQGYGVYKTLSPSAGLHGGYHAFTATGSDYQLWGSSRSLLSIVDGATPVTIVSSATINATWDCADTQGNSYCVNSNRDAYIKTDGNALITWYTTPLGTMVESTPDRVVVAGVSASPNTLFVSQSNTFTNYTVGSLTTDAFTEVIAAPGSKLTHLRWGCQKLLWWKDQSFGYFDFEDQFAAQVKIVSDNIGTVDNTSAIDPGGNVWFRGQDGHTYKYDCSSLEKMTIDITPQIQSAGRRTTNAWTQTTQADFAAGGIGFNGPTVALSTTTVPASVVPSTVAFIDTSSSDFSQGTFSAGLDTTSVSGAFTLKTYLNDTFSNMSNWTQVCGTIGTGSGYADMGASADNTFEQVTSSSPTGDFIVQYSFSATGATPSAQSFEFMVSTTTGLGLSNVGYYVSVKAVATGSLFVVALASTSNASNGFWNDGTVTCNSPGVVTGSSGQPGIFISTFSVAYDTSNHTLKWTRDNTTGAMSLYLDGTLKTTATNTNLNVFKKLYVAGQAGGAFHWHLDDLYFTARQGNFTSRQFDTLFSTPVWGTFTSNTSGTGSFAYATRTSADGSSYTSDTAISSGDKITSSTRRYLLYSSTLTTTQVTSLPQVVDVTIYAASTGTYYSAVKNAPSLTSWSTFGPSTSGEGTHTFYIRSSSNSFDVLSPTPTWTAQTANAQVVVTTYTYFQVRDDFLVTSGTQAPSLNDFTINWFEGSAGDQAYMLYFDNAIWETVAYGTGASSNTYVFRHDLINPGWTLYNFGSGGFLIQANKLYFGSVGDGNVFQFGSGTSDNGSSINAYWKSKDYTGADPFLQSQLTQIDSFAKKNQGSTLTATYALDTSTTTTSYSIGLSSTTQSVVQSRKLLPSGKQGYTFNIQYGDTSTSSAWELFGFRIGHVQQPYRPGN